MVKQRLLLRLSYDYARIVADKLYWENGVDVKVERLAFTRIVECIASCLGHFRNVNSGISCCMRDAEVSPVSSLLKTAPREGWSPDSQLVSSHCASLEHRHACSCIQMGTRREPASIMAACIVTSRSPLCLLVSPAGVHGQIRTHCTRVEGMAAMLKYIAFNKADDYVLFGQRSSSESSGDLVQATAGTCRACLAKRQDTTLVRDDNTVSDTMILRPWTGPALEGALYASALDRPVQTYAQRTGFQAYRKMIVARHASMKGFERCGDCHRVPEDILLLSTVLRPSTLPWSLRATATGTLF